MSLYFFSNASKFRQKNRCLSAHGQVFQYYGTFTRTFLSMFEARGFGGPSRMDLDPVLSPNLGDLGIVHACLSYFAIVN